ncbi:helix-turn-helix domain-containing protein [Cetobacterium sp.]|uniref:helix-turn-helix domain-containing protein n=1 Tax=Cetobacterium sp. TaxID=2071632 RepID=UPI003F4043EA
MKSTIVILEDILKKYKISKSSLARKMEVTPQFLNSIFKGERKLNYAHIDKIKKNLKLTKIEVMELKKSITIPEDPDVLEWLEKLEDAAYKFELLSSNKGLEEIIDNVYKIKKSKTRENILEYILYQLSKEK